MHMEPEGSYARTIPKASSQAKLSYWLGLFRMLRETSLDAFRGDPVASGRCSGAGDRRVLNRRYPEYLLEKRQPRPHVPVADIKAYLTPGFASTAAACFPPSPQTSPTRQHLDR